MSAEAMTTEAGFREVVENGRRRVEFTGSAGTDPDGGGSGGGGGGGETVTLNVWTDEGLMQLTLAVSSAVLLTPAQASDKRKVLQCMPSGSGYAIGLDDGYATGV